jgi:Spy/CpxP family protein refolding chaperone
MWLHGPRRLDDLQKFLNLDEAQRRKMEEVFEKYRAQIQRQIRETRSPVLDQIEKMRHEIEQILTPEQREKLRAASLLFERRLRLPIGRGAFERDSLLVPGPHFLLEE